MKDDPIVLLDSGEKSSGQMQTKKKDRRRLRHEHWLQSQLIVATMSCLLLDLHILESLKMEHKAEICIFW